jgi:hypothetical protein
MTRVIPGLNLGFDHFDSVRTLPYLILFLSFFFIKWIRKNRQRSYKEFLDNSPGIEINTEGINYGVGHGRNKKDN